QGTYDVLQAQRAASMMRPGHRARVVESLHPAVNQVKKTMAAVPNAAGAVLEHRFDHIQIRAPDVAVSCDQCRAGPEASCFGGSHPKRSFLVLQSPKHICRGENIQRSRFTLLPKIGVAVVSALP